MATETDEPLVLRSDDDGVTTLTLNRPSQYNALSESLIGAVEENLGAVARDDSVRAVILAGAGKAFSAGHDLKEMRAQPKPEKAKDYYERLFRRCGQMMLTVGRIPQPVIARVHGIATAAGCQLVASCDLAVASTDARFATSGINVGLFCATPAVPVSRTLARKHAMEMLITGEFISAATAAAWGLVNRAVAPEALDAETRALARRIADLSPLAVRTGKRMFYRQIEQPLEAAYDYACDVMAENMMADDAGEGIDAFIEKRKPRWSGR